MGFMGPTRLSVPNLAQAIRAAIAWQIRLKGNIFARVPKSLAIHLIRLMADYAYKAVGELV